MKRMKSWPRADKIKKLGHFCCHQHVFAKQRPTGKIRRGEMFLGNSLDRVGLWLWGFEVKLWTRIVLQKKLKISAGPLAGFIQCFFLISAVVCSGWTRVLDRNYRMIIQGFLSWVWLLWPIIGLGCSQKAFQSKKSCEIFHIGETLGWSKLESSSNICYRSVVKFESV